jgi:hypothetical protein
MAVMILVVLAMGSFICGFLAYSTLLLDASITTAALAAVEGGAESTAEGLLNISAPTPAL